MVALVPLLLVAATGVTIEPSSSVGLPQCSSAETPALSAGYDQWAETLLDPSHAVGPGYVPPDLRSQNVGRRTVTLRRFVFRPLKEMLAAASDDGVTIVVNSGYRSYAQQAELELDMSHQHDLVAHAGHSEHQLGTTVDLAGGTDWLRENAWRFGFVMSYPAERSPSWTCYPHEPWHFRYFGRERAAAISTSGLSAREWLWQQLHAGAR
jgi:D-alanyl-D-alanine carboxypeptidase